MSKSINPATAVAVIVAVLVGALGMVIWKGTQSPAGTRSGEAAPAMPSDVQQEFQKRMGASGGGVTGPPAQDIPRGMPRMGK
jgi:hypothetical protein